MKKRWLNILKTGFSTERYHWVMLFYRVLVAFAIIRIHGWKKITGFEEEVLHIPDPFGFGGYTATVMAILSNVVCSVFVAFGLFTRLAAFGAMMVPLIGLLVIHIADPWPAKDAPWMYSLAFLVILLMGPGKYSLDNWMYKKLKN